MSRPTTVSVDSDPLAVGWSRQRRFCGLDGEPSASSECQARFRCSCRFNQVRRGIPCPDTAHRGVVCFSLLIFLYASPPPFSFPLPPPSSSTPSRPPEGPPNPRPIRLKGTSRENSRPRTAGGVLTASVPPPEPGSERRIHIPPTHPCPPSPLPSLSWINYLHFPDPSLTSLTRNHPHSTLLTLGSPSPWVPEHPSPFSVSPAQSEFALFQSLQCLTWIPRRPSVPSDQDVLNEGVQVLSDPLRVHAPSSLSRLPGRRRDRGVKSRSFQDRSCFVGPP